MHARFIKLLKKSRVRPGKHPPLAPQAWLHRGSRQAARAVGLDRSHQLILDSINEGVIVCDREGRVTRCNPAAQQILGVGAASGTITRWFGRFRLFQNDGKTPLRLESAPLFRALQGETVSNEKILIKDLSSDRSDLWVAVNASPLRNRSGRIRGAVTIFRDISEEQQREEALRKSEARTRLILESTYDAFISVDPEGRIIDWNRQAELTFGWTRAEVQGRSLVACIIPRRLRGTFGPGVDFLRQKSEKSSFDRRIRAQALHKLGHELPIEILAYPIQHGDQVLYGAFLQDITDKLRNERLIATQMALSRIMAEAESIEEASEQFLEAIACGIGWEAGELWRKVEAPGLEHLSCLTRWCQTKDSPAAPVPALEKMQLLPGEGFPGQVWLVKKPLWGQDLLAQTLDQLSFKKHGHGGFQAAFGFPMMMQGVCQGVICFYSSEPRPRDEELLSTMADIGGRLGMFIQRKEAEKNLAALRLELEERVQARTEELADANARLLLEIEERRHLYEETQHASRLKDEFLATVSHELRTPLNVILGHSELLRDAMLPEEERDSIEAIYRNAKVQSDIIDDLLDVSRIITGKLQLRMETISIPSILHAAVDAVAPAARAKSIDVDVHIDPRALQMQADPSRLQQVIWNLLSNAIKFTPKKGSISLSALLIGEGLVIDIKDNGQGIDPKFLPYVFERFRQEDTTTTRVHGGLGLGLSIVRHLVEAHNGSVSVRSEGKGRGAHFSVRIPLALPLDRKGAQELPKQGERDEQLQGLRVLAVDDQADNRQLITSILKRTGAMVAVASSAREALELFGSFKPHVLLSDISMPEIDGYELIRTVRSLSAQEGGQIPAAALSAYAREEERRQALAAGYQVHVAKPIEAKALIKTLADLAGLEV